MTQDTRRWRLVCYDIRSPSRYRKAYRLIRGHGERLQYSLFRCLLDDRQTEALRWRLAECLAPEDAVAIIDLCPHCASRAVAKNALGDDWELQPVGFRLVAPASDQGSGPRPRRPRDDER